MGNRHEAIERGDIDAAFYDIVAGFKALNQFLWYLREDGFAKPHEVLDGLHSLFENQAEQLDHVRSMVETKQMLLTEYSETIDALTHNLKSEPAATPRAVSLRDEFIAAKAQAGEKPGDIASAMNMKRASIEKVIQRLQGQTAPQTDRVVNA